MLTIDRIRTVSALVLSFVIHAGIMNLNGGWLHHDATKLANPRSVTMTLTARQPEKTVPSLKIIEESEAAPEKKEQQVAEQQIVRETEKVVVREVPPPVLLPEEHMVLKSEATGDKNVPEPRQEAAIPQPVTEYRPDIDSMGEKSVAEHVSDRIAVGQQPMEELGALPVILARPLYKENPRPIYPVVARRRRYQGTTLLEVLVDSQGRVGDLRVFQSSGHAVLDRAALAAVKDWLFEPGRRGDDKVDMWVRVPVRFQLR